MSPKRRIIPVFVPNAGCVYTCVFCDQRRISGVMAAASADDVRIAADNLTDADAPAELAFYGGSFTAMPKEYQDELLTAAQPFLEQSPLRSIRVSTRPDCIDEHIVAWLKQYGVETIELGAQSMSDDVLAESRRGHTSGDTARAAGLIKSAGLLLILQMMTGLPGDTREKSVYTARRFIELKPAGVRIYPTVVVRGTELFEMWQSGRYREHTVEEAVDLCAEICTMFNEADIPVIRLGLNPTKALSAGDAAAGAYHPAFGELVYSKMFYCKAAARLKDIPAGCSVTITVPKGSTSVMIGQKRRNIIRLMKEFDLKDIKIIEAPREVSNGNDSTPCVIIRQ